jgi:hypothetical protein
VVVAALFVGIDTLSLVVVVVVVVVIVVVGGGGVVLPVLLLEPATELRTTAGCEYVAKVCALASRSVADCALGDSSLLKMLRFRGRAGLSSRTGASCGAGSSGNS